MYYYDYYSDLNSLFLFLCLFDLSSMDEKCFTTTFGSLKLGQGRFFFWFVLFLEAELLEYQNTFVNAWYLVIRPLTEDPYRIKYCDSISLGPSFLNEVCVNLFWTLFLQRTVCICNNKMLELHEKLNNPIYVLECSVIIMIINLQIQNTQKKSTKLIVFFQRQTFTTKQRP